MSNEVQQPQVELSQPLADNPAAENIDTNSDQMKTKKAIASAPMTLGELALLAQAAHSWLEDMCVFANDLQTIAIALSKLIDCITGRVGEQALDMYSLRDSCKQVADEVAKNQKSMARFASYVGLCNSLANADILDDTPAPMAVRSHSAEYMQNLVSFSRLHLSTSDDPLMSLACSSEVADAHILASFIASANSSVNTAGTP